MNDLIAKLERRVALEKARDRAGSELDRVRAGLAPFTVQREASREAAVRFNAALGRMYGDQVAARRAIREFAQREGVAAVAREISSRPERFGVLRGTERGPIRSAKRRKAVEQAQTLGSVSEEYLGKVGIAREQAPEYREARAAVARAEAKVQRLDKTLERGPGAAQLRLRIREKMRSLQPGVRRDLHLRLSPAQRLLVGASLAVGVAFVREQGHER